MVACGIDNETGQLTRQRLCPDPGQILAWLVGLAGPVRVVYEAGPTGFGLYRALTAAGIETVVAAPSKLAAPGRGSGQDRRSRRAAPGAVAAPG